MARVALLPAGGDPFLLAYWAQHYRQWCPEVDSLWVHVVGQSDPDVIAYIARQFLGSDRVTNQGGREPHGQVLRRMAAEADPDDVVLFLEDDAFVRHPGVIDERFRLVESGAVDVVGTARGNATPNLIARAEELYGPSPITTSGETGLSLYPCFLFARRRDIPDHLDSCAWKAGDHIEALDYTCTAEEACDTFTHASWVMRQRGLRIKAEAAYRSDSAHAPQAGWRTVDGGANTGDAPWFHVGSLSSGYGCAFLSDPGTYDFIVQQVRQPTEQRDWAKRASWWTRVRDSWDGGLPDFHRRYSDALDRFIADAGLDPAEIARWRANYDPLVTWREA